MSLSMNNQHENASGNTNEGGEDSKVRVMISLPKTLNDKARQKAKGESRSLSGHIVHLLLKDAKGEFNEAHLAGQKSKG